MSVLNQLACFQNRRDEIPNQELAKILAEKKDTEGIAEIAENLWNKNKNIQNDCIKVLYEVGYINPSLISGYAPEFIKLLSSKNNRLVWGGMIALSTVAEISPLEIMKNFDYLKKIISVGSVITVDGGIKTLAKAASADEKINKKIFSYLMDHLNGCRPKEVPMHAEFIIEAVNKKNKNEFIEVLTKRISHFSKPQAARINKLLKRAESL